MLGQKPEEPERRTANAKRGTTTSPRPPKWFLWERVFRSSCPARFPGCISSPMEKRVLTKTILEAVGSWFPALRVRFCLGLFGLWPHMTLASRGSGDTDHVRVMQRVAGPEA